MTAEAEAAYTVAEAAKRKGVSVDTLKRAIKRTEPPFLRAKKVGNRTRISATALDEWWEQLPDA